MKAILFTIIAIVFALYATAEETNITMKTAWVVSTNWQPAGESRTLMWPESANVSTYHERGMAYSNLIGVIEWKGKLHTITLDSVLFAECERSYTTKIVREYGAEHSWPASVFYWPDGTTTNVPNDIWINRKTNIYLISTNPASIWR